MARISDVPKASTSTFNHPSTNEPRYNRFHSCSSLLWALNLPSPASIPPRSEALLGPFQSYPVPSTWMQAIVSCQNSVLGHQAYASPVMMSFLDVSCPNRAYKPFCPTSTLSVIPLGPNSTGRGSSEYTLAGAVAQGDQ
ncbi:UNVERIFIED_CONTAM: hypothetical protein K2H54_029947 [Gekko kuhli]